MKTNTKQIGSKILNLNECEAGDIIYDYGKIWIVQDVLKVINENGAIDPVLKVNDDIYFQNNSRYLSYCSSFILIGHINNLSILEKYYDC